MHIVYNALETSEKQSDAISEEMELRLMAYTETCDKYRREIAAIRQYLPGWTPAFYAKA